MGYTAFDLEIKEPVSDEPGGKSWADAREGRCGVSVLCLYDSDLDEFLFFDDHNLLDGFEYLSNSDMVVGYNSAAFDIPCLEGALGAVFPMVPHFDILRSVWSKLGKRRKGYRLAEVAQRTLHQSKSASGEFATTLWAQGRHAELYTYCMRDVKLTAQLFDHILEKGYIVDVEGNPLEVHTIGSIEAGVTTPAE